MIAAPSAPRQARPRRPISTLRPGERVVVDLRGPALDRINGYGGGVVAVDDTAVRLDAAWSRFSLSPSPASGEIATPWARIDRDSWERADTAEAAELASLTDVLTGWNALLSGKPENTGAAS